MMRCFCHGLHGCAPVPPSVKPSPSTSSRSWARRLGTVAAASEGLAATSAHLDLGRDQLADEMRLQLGALRGRLELLEAVGERERRRVEDRELLLDRDREVRRGLVLLAAEPQLLVATQDALVG